jgi:uncharacterized delta-60 repeat protein
MSSVVRVSWLLLALWLSAAGCGGTEDRDGQEGDDSGAPDGGSDGGAEPAPVDDFAIEPAAARLFLRQGESADVEVTLTRASDFDEPVTVELGGLPAGVTASAVTIASGETSGLVTVDAAGDSAQGALDVDVIGAAGDIAHTGQLRLVVAGGPGTLDQTFAAGGKFTFQQDGMPSLSSGLASQPDGQIVVTGQSGDEASLQTVTIRVNPDGSLDDSFGTGGSVVTVIGEASGASRVKTARDGQRIFVAGVDTPDLENTRMDVVTYTSDGELDAGFASGGIVIVDTGAGNALAHDIIALDDGAVLLVGRHLSPLPESVTTMVVRRVTATGEIDPTFSIDVAGLGPRTAMLDGKGRLVVVGSTSGADVESFIARFLPDGSADPSFGGDGVVEMNLAVGSVDQMKGVTELDGGQLLVTGYSDGDTRFLAQVRFDPDGSLDPTFGEKGVAIIDRPLVNILAAEDALGRTVVTGKLHLEGNDSVAAVARILPDGTLDATFGDGGLVTVPFAQGGVSEDGTDIIIDADGRIVIAAETDFAAQSFGVARLWP